MIRTIAGGELAGRVVSSFGKQRKKSEGRGGEKTKRGGHALQEKEFEKPL